MEPSCTSSQTGDDDITGWDINANGWVAGDAFPDYHWAFVWKEAARWKMPPVNPGQNLISTTPMKGLDPTNSCSLQHGTGYAELPGPLTAPTSAYFTYQIDRGGVISDLGTLGGELAWSRGYAINDSDTVAGVSQTSPMGPDHAIQWTPGEDSRSAGHQEARQHELGDEFFNAPNLIVGQAETTNGAAHAFLYSSGKMTNPEILAGNDSDAFGDQ